MQFVLDLPPGAGPGDAGQVDAGQVAGAVVSLLRAVLPPPACLRFEPPARELSVACNGAALAQFLGTLCLAVRQALPERTVLAVEVERHGPQGAPAVILSGFGSAGPNADRIMAAAEGAARSGLAACPGAILQRGGPRLVLLLPDARPAASAARLRILLVDDEADLTDVMSIGLQRHGYEVVAFNRPLEALSAFTAAPHDFDLVITDYIMPDLDGEQLCHALRACRTDLRVILCTGYGEPFGEGYPRGPFDAVLDKPVDIAGMPGIIRALHRAG